MTRIFFNRGVNEELFYYWLGDFMRSYNGFYENDTFMVRDYDYGSDDEEGPNEYHFYHKPSGLKIYWYKYPFRASASNMEITYEQFREVLIDCKNSIIGRKQYNLVKTYFWEAKNE